MKGLTLQWLSQLMYLWSINIGWNHMPWNRLGSIHVTRMSANKLAQYYAVLAWAALRSGKLRISQQIHILSCSIALERRQDALKRRQGPISLRTASLRSRFRSAESTIPDMSATAHPFFARFLVFRPPRPSSPWQMKRAEIFSTCQYKK